MPSTSRNDETPRRGGPKNLDEDDTLREVGQDPEFELDDEIDADRRRDPLRQPH